VEDLLQTNYALDTFYFLVMGALVMFMAPGFAMLEAGMVRAKNTAEILTKNVALYSIACIMYLLVGYYIMYSSPEGGILPDFGFWLGDENTLESVTSGDAYYSARSDYFFQVVFVATAMSIVSGAVAERMKLWAFLGFAVVMTGFIYPIQGFWKWGGGWLQQMEVPFQDFAGSGVVHMCGAAAALAGVLLLGARKGKYGADGSVHPIPGCNMTLATLGMFILWFGWFGFNGGSQLVISNVADANAVAQIFVNTNIAAAGGLVAALVTAHILFGKADLTMALNGALAGLVSITAEPLTPLAQQAVLIGAVGGVIVVFAIIMLDRLKIDDPVGAISVHGVAGIWGLLIVPWTNSDAGLISQIIGIAAIFAWVFGASFAVWTILKATMGIRVSEEDEYDGVDLSECGLEAYPEFHGSQA
jgi:Amt family ammonium transporter